MVIRVSVNYAGQGNMEDRVCVRQQGEKSRKYLISNWS